MEFLKNFETDPVVLEFSNSLFNVNVSYCAIFRKWYDSIIMIVINSDMKITFLFFRNWVRTSRSLAKKSWRCLARDAILVRPSSSTSTRPRPDTSCRTSSPWFPNTRPTPRSTGSCRASGSCTRSEVNQRRAWTCTTGTGRRWSGVSSLRFHTSSTT